MFPNQLLKARAGLAALLIAFVGCSSHRARDTESAPTAHVPTSYGAENTSTAPPDLTATEAAVAGGGAQAPSSDSGSGAPPALVLNPSAPKSYTEKHGDTLWGISTMFLRDPWLWPEIWYVNPRIENPHLIYPGDVLALAYGADGRPQIQLMQGGPARLDPRLRSSPLDG